MEKYRGVFDKDELIYSNTVEIEAPCGIVCFASLLTSNYKGIPIYKQVGIDSVEKYENGKYSRLTKNDMKHIESVLESERVCVLN